MIELFSKHISELQSGAKPHAAASNTQPTKTRLGNTTAPWRPGTAVTTVKPLGTHNRPTAVNKPSNQGDIHKPTITKKPLNGSTLQRAQSMKALNPVRPQVAQSTEAHPWNGGTSLSEIHSRSDGTYMTPSLVKVKRSQSMSRLTGAPRSGLSSTERSASAHGSTRAGAPNLNVQRSTSAAGLNSKKCSSNLSERKPFIPGGTSQNKSKSGATSLNRSQSMKTLPGATSQKKPISRSLSFNARKDNKPPTSNLTARGRDTGKKNTTNSGAYSKSSAFKPGVKRQADSKPVVVKSKCPRKSILKLPTETPGKEIMENTDRVDGAVGGERPGNPGELLDTGDPAKCSKVKLPFSYSCNFT